MQVDVRQSIAHNEIMTDVRLTIIIVYY